MATSIPRVSLTKITIMISLMWAQAVYTGVLSPCRTLRQRDMILYGGMVGPTLLARLG